MSGHSKWANIRVRKTAEDAKRGKVFTRHARLIEMAARAGGGDPVMNNALRTAVENARAENVPNANIERAIKKGTGALQGEQMAEILYAAFGPGGVACLIECLTDNRNRTIANIKMIINKSGGTFADTGAVVWMFERKGVVAAGQPQTLDVRHETLGELELQIIDLGAENIEADGTVVTVVTNQSDWVKVRDFLKGKGFEVVEAGLKYVAREKVEIADRVIMEKIAAFVDALEAEDDVVEVYPNATTAET